MRWIAKLSAAREQVPWRFGEVFQSDSGQPRIAFCSVSRIAVGLPVGPGLTSPLSIIPHSGNDLTCGDPAGSAQISNTKDGNTRITACEFRIACSPLDKVKGRLKLCAL